MGGSADHRAPHSPAHGPSTAAVTLGCRKGIRMSVITATAPRSIMAVARDYVSLLKLRIVLLLDATAVGVMIPAAHGHPQLGAVVAVLVGGTFAAGGAHAINCWFDRDIDAEMTRTRRRPLPAGRIPPWHALAIGIVLNVLAFAVLWAGANLLAAALALAGTLIYVFVYTVWLKRNTPQNIVIGGAPGAVPPLVGWAAATGHLDATALAFFGVIFFWTPPHFWALAQMLKTDYARASVPMLPAVGGESSAKRQSIAYAMLTGAVSVVPFFTGMAGAVYLAGAVVLGLGLLAVTLLDLLSGVPTNSPRSLGVRGVKSRGWTRRVFAYSITYVAVLFVLFAVSPFLP